MNAHPFPHRRPTDAELWARCASTDPAARAEALRQLAARAARQGRTAAAVDLLEAAIASFELAGDDLPRGLALVALAEALMAAGRARDAVDTAFAALALLDLVGGDRHIADAWWMLAGALRASLAPAATAPCAPDVDDAADRAGDLAELAEVAERAALAAERAGTPLVPGRARLMCGEVLLEASLAEEAVLALRAAAASARDGRDPLTAADAQRALGAALLTLDRATEARDVLRELPDAYGYLQCDDRAASAFEVLAGVHTALGDELAARDCLASAAELYARAGDLATAAAAELQWARRVLESPEIGEAQRVDAEEVARASGAVLALLA